MIYQVLILILPLITVPYVARVLGADGVGIHSYTYSISYYFMLIAMLGLNNYGNRSIAKVRDNKDELSKTFWSIYLLQFIVSTLMVITYLIYIILFNIRYKQIAVIQIFYVISSIFDINWFFFGLEKFKITIIRNTIIKIISLVSIFLFVRNSDDLWVYTLILSGSTFLSQIILWPYIKKYVNFTKIKIIDILKHLKPCLILFIPVIAVSIYKIMDKIMLGNMASIVEVGYYENAVKIIDVPKCIITSLGTVMLPRMSNMIAKGEEEKIKMYIGKSLQVIMFLALPITMGLIAISDDFILIFLGNNFTKTGTLIKYLAISLIFLSWANVIRTQYLIPKERDKDYIISVILGAIVNLVMNIILIPRYASIGACYGTICAELIVMLYQTYKVKNELNISVYIKNIMIFVINSLIMFIIVDLLNYIPMSIYYRLILQVIIGIIIYIVLNFKYIITLVDFKFVINKFTTIKN
ncbi:MAG: flippase [Clostridiales bacterium]|nr:flippase [Clostridiales bacterium]